MDGEVKPISGIPKPVFRRIARSSSLENGRSGDQRSSSRPESPSPVRGNPGKENIRGRSQSDDVISVGTLRSNENEVAKDDEDPWKKMESEVKEQVDVDVYAESVSVKTAVRMFGGEAKIRKLPTPDRSLSSKKKEDGSERNLKEQALDVANFDEDIDDIDISAHANDIMNYTICGTISPLSDPRGTSQVSGSHSSDSISFVFGRPTSPLSDRGPRRCKSPPSATAIRRTFSPPSGPTVRKRGVNDKPPIGGPPSRRRVRSQTSVHAQGGNFPTSDSFTMDILRQNGVYCEQCNMCLADFKRQALRLLYPDGPRGGAMIKTPLATEKIEEKLQVPPNCQKLLKVDRCDVCHANLRHLKKEAVAMVASIQNAQSEPLPVSSGIPVYLASSHARSPQRTSTTGNSARQPRTSRASVPTSASTPALSTPYTDQLPRGQNSSQKQNQILAQQQQHLQQHQQQRAYNSSQHESAGFSQDMMSHPVEYLTYQHGGPSGVQYRGQHPGHMNVLHQDKFSAQIAPPHVPPHLQMTAPQMGPPVGMESYHMTERLPPGPLEGHTPPQVFTGINYQTQNVPNFQGQNMPNYQGQNMPSFQGQNMPNYHAFQYSHSHYSVPCSVPQGAQFEPHPYVNYSSPPPTQQPPAPPMSPPPLSRVSSPGSSSQQSAAASFFARAAQKLGKKKKRHQQSEPELPQFPTKYNEVLRVSPPPAPPCLLRAAGRLQQPGVGKVKVMLKICASGCHGEQGQSCLSVDPRKKQVTVFDPSAIGITTSAHRRGAPVAPKMFAFDAVFSPDDSQTELCASSLTEIIQGVVNGADGCLFTYGYSRQGKSTTMLGTDNSAQTLGVLPCAISWLFRLINEQKEKTGARFSVRVSAVEVSGKNERLKDLLSDIAQTTEAGLGTAPGVYLREDPICGTQLENQSELRAPTADRAAFYLDAALASRLSDEEEGRSSHLLFTLHVYQYRIEKANQAGLPGVAGGRSRLHLIDLGSSSKSKDPDNVSLSISALGNVIMALLNGQRHVPHRDSKIAQLLRDSLGNISCRTCMIAHVSSGVVHHNETLQIIQLAARIHRMRRRKTRFSSTSSDDSSTDDGRLRRPFQGFRMGTLREDAVYTSSHSDPDYTSSSEQSCDTVIYVGANGQSLSDREITDNEGPPRSVPRTNPRLPRRPSGSRSSGDEGSNSDSGRSRSSADFRYGRAALVNRDIYHVNRTLSPRVSTAVRDVSVVPQHVQSPPMSPNVSSVARKVNVRSRPMVSKSDDIPEKIQRAGVKGIQDGGIKGEQWVDGPGMVIYPETRTAGEQWVDGPQAFVVKAESAAKTDAVNKHLYNPKMNAEEQWVDGPREMIAPGHRDGRGHTKAAVHSSCKAERRTHSQESKGSPSHGSRSKSKPPQDGKDRPDSTASADSNTSMLVQGADSRPGSCHVEGDKQGEENGENVKPFVRDWVEKHSAINEESNPSNSNVGFIVNYDNQVIGTLESTSKHKRQKPESHRKLSASTPKQSPHHSPKNSPSLHRKDKSEGNTCKLQKSQLPTSSNPTKRVTEWLKSVSHEQQSHRCDSSKMCDEGSCSNQDINKSQDISSCSSIHLDTSMDDCGTTINTAPCSSDGRPDEMAECAAGDISFDSSVDTASASEMTNLLNNNRESIYEIQMDEQLEKSGDNRSVIDVHDNDTFSSASCSKDNEFSDNEEGDDEPLLARDSNVPHSLTVESLKTLIAEENQKLHLEDVSEVSKPCNCKGCDISSMEKEKMDKIPHLGISKSLLRKPDGASNPNLINELNYDGKIDMNVMRGEYIINHVHALSSQQEFNSYKNSTSDLECLPKHPDLLEKDFNECSRNATKSKPPLPNAKQLKSHSASPSRSSKSKDTSLSPKSNTSISSRNSSIPVSSHSGRSKEKSRLPSTSSISSQRSNSLPITASPSSTSTTRSTSSKSSKTQSPVSSRLPLFRQTLGKDSKTRKKEKESKVGNGRVGELNRNSGRGTDSDSGNDSGIVTSEKKLLSPYCTVTKPRTPSHSSSGHGSDNSSTVSADLRSQLGIKDKLHGGTSSGYESMLRDSENDASSSAHEDSNSESSSDKKKGSKRKRSSTRRSRSAPAHSSESPERKGSNGSGKATSPSPKAWVDTRQIQKIKEEPFEIKLYDMDDVERLQRRRAEDESKEEEAKKEKSKQSNKDSNDPKDHIVMEDRNWGFDCKFLMCFCRSKNKKTDV